MISTRFSLLCLAGILASQTLACAQDASETGSSEDGVSVVAGLPDMPIPIVLVSGGKFSLTRNLDQPDPGSVTTLDIKGDLSGGGSATLTTTSTTGPVPAGLPEGEPILPPGLPTPGRTYSLSASQSACGKTYTGRNPGASIKIYDYRSPGTACAAMIASPIFVEETVNGATSTWYGKGADGEVLPADATKIVAKNSGGGFTPPPPPGSECAVGAGTYELSLGSRRLAWETCKFVDWSTPLRKVKGARTLTESELATVLAAAKAVTVTHEEMCGADKPLLTMTVSTPASSVTYTDNFYSCFGDGPFVDRIDGVFSAFRAVVGE